MAMAASTRRWVVAASVAVAVAVVGAIAIWAFTTGSPSATPSTGGSTAGPTATSADPSSAVSSPTTTSSSAGPKPSKSRTSASAGSTSATSQVPSASVPSPTATGSATVVPTEKTSTTERPIDKPGKLGNGVTVKVSKIEKIKGEATGPGEIAGPALRVTITVDNDTAKSISMGSALANLYYGPDDSPAGVLSGPGAKSFPDSIAARGKASGVYVFNVPKESQDQIAVEFSYTTKAPTVIFKGSA